MMAKVKNAFWDEINRDAYFDELDPHEPSDCEGCDGFGGVWNDGDVGTGQRADCEECGDTRGQP